jgi:hypothetical protein
MGRPAKLVAFDAGFRSLVGDISLHRLGGGDICLAARAAAALESRDAAM